MSRTKKSSKRLIIISIVIVLLAACAVGLWMLVQYQNDQKTVEVIPVSQISSSSWESSSSSGLIKSDYVQEIYPDSSKIISEIFVTEGQEVRIGDPILQYDKEQLELDVEIKKVALTRADLNIDTAQKQLKKYQNTKPVSTSKPTTSPTRGPTPTRRPTNTPKPATPTPVPPADVNLYSRLDLDSVPYKGSGASTDPYVFLCTEDCIVTPEFLRRLLGIGAVSTPAPSPTPEPEDNPDEPVSSGIIDFPDEDAPATPTPSPSPVPEPESILTSPFAAIFEVRDGNSNYGDLISAFKLDGNELSAGFQMDAVLSGYNTLESIASLFGATPTPKPTSNPDNYNDMGYTSDELKELISAKKQEIQELQLARKQAKLDLDKANFLLKNSTVLSTVDGTVRTLIDQETAAAESRPFLVISGDSTYYVSGALPENLLGVVELGDPITVNNYMTGSTFTAQIVGISDYPLDSDSGLYYYGSGNPNSSMYELTAVVEEPQEDLQNGQYVDITLDVQNTESVDALYIERAYVREDDSGSYVMKAGIDNRLIKQYVQTGKFLYAGGPIEIKSGLTMDDYVAFPYGPDVKEGVRARVQGSEDEPMVGDDAIPTLTDGVAAAVPEGDLPAVEEEGLPDEDGETGETGEGGEELPEESGTDGSAIDDTGGASYD